MVVCRLDQFPALDSFLPEEIFEPLNPSLARVMDKTLARLAAFNDGIPAAV